MTDIYEQHDRAFARVEAFALVRNRHQAGKIAFKFPADGAGRLWAYVHLYGFPMVRGFASGGGYDKRTAACADAARKLIGLAVGFDHDNGEYFKERHGPELIEALRHDGGFSWETMLRREGFEVWRAI
jgi:hypothetical protein